jgi:translation initiation factor 4E
MTTAMAVSTIYCILYSHITADFAWQHQGTALHSGYTFWYMRRGKNTKASTEPDKEEPSDGPGAAAGPAGTYENSIKNISTAMTVEEFWDTYNYLVRPNDLPSTTDYHLFRLGIKPTWEDPNNVKGGKWIVRLKKGLASRYWEESMLALIGGQFTGVPEGEICGVVVSIRYSEDILGIWNKSAADRELTERIREAIKKILQLPSHAHMEYKPHSSSLQDKSSFRNTQVWKPKDGAARQESSVPRERRSGSWGERDDTRTSKAKRDVERSWR